MRACLDSRRDKRGAILYRLPSGNLLTEVVVFKPITLKKTPDHLTLLDTAGHAISNGDFSALAQAAQRIEAVIPAARYLVEPLIIVSDHLARDKSHLSEAVFAARCAAFHAPAGSPLELRAVSSWAMHVNALPDLKGRIAAAKAAAIPAPYGSVLKEEAVGVLLNHLGALPTDTQRVDAAKVAAVCAPPGSLLDEQAARVWSQQVQALPEAQTRIAAAASAAVYALPGSPFSQQALKTWAQQVEALPEADQRIEAVDAALRRAADGTPLSRLASTKRDTEEGRVLPVVPDVLAARRFADSFNLG